MKVISFFLLVFLVHSSCSHQVVQTQSRIEEPIQNPTKPKSKLAQKRDRIRQVMIGNQIPDGLIIDRQGQKHSTLDYRGKLLVIDFWATWCGPCLRGAPKFKEIGERYESDKVAFISISIDQEMDTWNSFLTQQKWSGNHFWLGMNQDEDLFSFLYKEVNDEGNPLVIVGVPKYVIISPEGKILDNEAEFPTNPKFEERIKKLVQIYK